MLISDMVSELIGEIGGDSSDTALQAKIFGYIKSGMRIMPASVRARTLTSRQSFVLPVGNASFNLATLSPGFIREREFSYVDTNGKEVPIDDLSVDMFIQQKDQNATAYPKYYNVGNKVVYFDRQPPFNLTINADYFCAITESLLTSSNFVLGEDQIELVKFLAKMYYYEYQEDDAKHDRNQAKARFLLDELESRYIEDELGGFPDET